MSPKRTPALLFVTALLLTNATAHPMGNFSVSHYSLIELKAKGVHLTYVLDLAELPTLELFQRWKVEAAASPQVHAKAVAQANDWLRHVDLLVGGHKLAPHMRGVEESITDGAGGMSVARITIHADYPSAPGAFSYTDGNYASRTGWKEIVIRARDGVQVENATASDRDISKGLTTYPADLTFNPPQDLQASALWRGIADAPVHVPLPIIAHAQPGEPNAPKVADRSTLPPPVAAPSFASTQPTAPGTVQRGDYLSRMLHEKHFSVGMILIGLLVAFGFGAMHALSPGHGKTIVAAYLVGSRGTLKHALFLGGMVTFTHTASVFLLGIGVLFFEKYVVPDQIIPILGAISGLSIVAIGGFLLFKRCSALLESSHGHSHHSHEALPHHAHASDHHHLHAAPHVHAQQGGAVLVADPVTLTHDHPHVEPHHHHEHDHDHLEHHHHNDPFVHTHSHNGHTHSHVVPAGRVTLGSLIALGISGGMVPCPSALILLLGAIALGRTGLGLLLLTAFSAGLAIVLMAIGALVLFARHLLPDSEKTRQHRALRLIPVFSSVVIIIVGLAMTLSALGVLQPIRGI